MTGSRGGQDDGGCCGGSHDRLEQWQLWQQVVATEVNGHEVVATEANQWVHSARQLSARAHSACVWGKQVVAGNERPIPLRSPQPNE